MSSGTTGLKRIIFFESATFRYVDLDIASNTLLLGDSGIGKTSIMRATLFFYTMDYSNAILGISDNELKKSFIEWYFDVAGASHIVYLYETVNGRFLFIVSRHKNLKYTFVNITEYEDRVEEILLDASSRSISAEELDIRLATLNLEHYSTTKRDEYRKIFVKNEYSKLGASFLQKNLSHVKYYLFQDMSDIQMYGKYLSKIFLSNRVSEASIKEIFTSLVSLDGNSEQYEVMNKIDVVDIDTRLEKLQKYENDHNRFTSRLTMIDAIALLLERYYEKQKKFTQNKKSLVVALHNKERIIEYFQEKISTVESELLVHQSKKETIEEELGKEIIDISALIIAHQNSIFSNEKELQKYADMNIEQMLAQSAKQSEYEELIYDAKQELSLLRAERTELENKTKQEELNRTQTINIKYAEEENRLNKTIEKIDSEKETLDYEKEEYIREELHPLTIKIEEKKDKYHTKQLEIVKLSGDIKTLENSVIETSQIIVIKNEIVAKNQNLALEEKESENISAQIEKVEEERNILSKSYSEQREKLEDIYKQKREIVKDDIAKLEEKKHQLSDYSSDTLFAKISRDENIYRDKIISIVDDAVLYDATIQVTKKDNADSLFGYEINLPYPSYENRVASLKEEIREKKIVLSLLDANHKKELASLDKSTRLEQEKKERLLKELTREKASKNSKIVNIKNQIQELETALEDEIEKETTLRNLHISKIEESLNKINSEEKIVADEIKQLEVSQAEKEKQIEEDFKKKSDAIRESKVEIREKLQNLKNQKSDEIRRTTKAIWDTYKTILQNQGVDTLKIEALSEAEKKYAMLLRTIDANREHVYTYKQRIGELEKTPIIRQKLKEFEEKKRDLQERKKEQSGRIETLITETVEHLQVNKTTMKRILNFYELIQESKNLLSLESVSMGEHYFPESELHYIEADVNKFCNSIATAKDFKSELRDIEDEFEKQINRITKGFSRDNTLNLPIVDDTATTIYDYINIAKGYIEYKNRRTHEQARGLSLGYVAETIGYIKASIENIRVKIEAIQILKNEINKIISQSIAHIAVLDFLSIEIEEDKTNPIIDKIDDLVDYAEQHSYIYIAGLIQEKDKEIYEHIHKKISNLKIELEIYKKSEIVLGDIISVSFKISENGKDLGTVYALNDVGSNGTGIMVRSIIYISLLYKNSMKCRIDTNQTFHCIIDEIGQISENYFEELMAFAKEKGFCFLNGIPVKAEEMIALYPTIYTGYKEKDKSIMLNTTKEVIEIEI